jgi:hypothetical protein
MAVHPVAAAVRTAPSIGEERHGRDSGRAPPQPPGLLMNLSTIEAGSPSSGTSTQAAR